MNDLPSRVEFAQEDWERGDPFYTMRFDPRPVATGLHLYQREGGRLCERYGGISIEADGGFVVESAKPFDGEVRF